MSSGPNTKVGFLGSLHDAAAFVHQPRLFIPFFLLAGPIRGLLFILSLIFVLPFYLADWLIGGVHFSMGNLSVVYDQAGKARVVAITNWWIQLVLEPLHRGIFKILRELPQDGTFDQDRPFDDLIRSLPEGGRLHGFDLSSATDRIPVSLQESILNLLGYNGSA